MRTLITRFLQNVRFYRSLKFRIFIIVLLIGIIPSVIVRLLMISSYRNRAMSQKTAEVTNQSAIVAAHLARTDYLSDPDNPVIDDELTQLSNLYDGRILVIDDTYRVIKDTYGKSQGRYIVSSEVISCMNGSRDMSSFDEVNNYLEITVPILDEVTGSVYGALVTSASTDGIKDNADYLGRRAYTVQVIVAVIVIMIAYALSATLLRPFDKVIKAVTSVKEGFDPGLESIEVPDYTETKDIMDAFHHLMSRMAEVDASREEFVANVSHELKTPLASIKVLSDSIRSGENIPVETYREFMDDIAQEVDRENRIITDLLELVRLDRQAVSLKVERTDLSVLIEEIIKRLEPIALERGIELGFKNEADKEVFADVDPIKLSQALMNIIENAVKYNKDFGWVKIGLDSDIQFAQITISDSGIGMSEEDTSRIFDRFYRADKSHSSQIVGNGLGLAITRSTILLHKGSVKVTSVKGEGSTFTVRIPLIYEA